MKRLISLILLISSTLFLGQTYAMDVVDDIGKVSYSIMDHDHSSINLEGDDAPSFKLFKYSGYTCTYVDAEHRWQINPYTKDKKLLSGIKGEQTIDFNFKHKGAHRISTFFIRQKIPILNFLRT